MTEGVAGFLAGDEDAVRSVYREYGGAVHTIARSMLSDPEVVKDVVQQTFLKAWRAGSSFDQSKPFAPWLYAIARRTCIDVLRKQGRGPTLAQELQSEPAVGDSGFGSMTFERTWEIFEVRRALDQLPEAEADVVCLSHLVGLSHAEIAEQLDIAIGTVKSRSARGHSRLVSALRHVREHGPPDG